MADIRDPGFIEEIRASNYQVHRKITRYYDKKHQSVYNIGLDRIAEVAEFRSHWNIEGQPIEIVIVGAGGTGGYLIRDLCRFLYSLDKRITSGTSKVSVVVYDGDVVEEKNILRQNFLPQDIGQNKAEVMAVRHSRAFGVDISYIPQMFTHQDLYNRNENRNLKRIIVGCVDNNAARREIARYLADNMESYSSPDVYWIDSGNEKKTGQVIVGNKSLMDVTDLYPEILLARHDSVEQVSCAERMLQDEQNMFVNLTAANLILNYIKNIVLDIPMVTHGTVFNIDNKFDNYYILNKTNVPTPF
jgi:PRTRC genetic system ThiF family protein